MARAQLSWTLDPGVLVLVGALIAVYVPRWRRVRRQEARAASLGRLACFTGGVLIILAALVSPLDGLSDQSFAAHMVQHVLLLDLAPILLILSTNRVLLRPATRRLSALERQAGPLAHPAFAVALYVVTIWAWHAPAAYDLALHNADVHALEHISFTIAGGLYWWHVLSPIRSRARLRGLGVIGYMAVTKVLVGMLGIGLAFVGRAFYPYYAHRAHIWGLTAVTDQSVAGLVMAVEQSIVMGAALTVLFVRMLSESEAEQRRRERYGLI